MIVGGVLPLGACRRFLLVTFHLIDLAQVLRHRPEDEVQDHGHAEHDEERDCAWLSEQAGMGRPMSCQYGQHRTFSRIPANRSSSGWSASAAGSSTIDL